MIRKKPKTIKFIDKDGEVFRKEEDDRVHTKEEPAYMKMPDGRIFKTWTEKEEVTVAELEALKKQYRDFTTVQAPIMERRLNEVTSLIARLKK